MGTTRRSWSLRGPFPDNTAGAQLTIDQSKLRSAERRARPSHPPCSAAFASSAMLNALTTARAPTAVMPLQNAARQLQQQLHRAPLRTPSTASALLARHGFLARSGEKAARSSSGRSLKLLDKDFAS